MSEQEGYIIEMTQVGGSVKVTAIDPETGREVSIIGAPSATQAELSQLAIRKLRYVLAKESGSL